MKPLAGRTILITRSHEQAAELASLLAGQGARVIEAPVIGFAEPDDWAPADAAFRRLDSYDRIILTSSNAVARFHARLKLLGLAVPERCERIAIGDATARRMREAGLPAHEVASVARAEGILELLSAGAPVAGQRILIPRAEVARELLPERLRAAGAHVDVVSVYRTIPVPVSGEVLEMLRLRQVDLIAFTSSSTVTNFLGATGGTQLLSGVVVAVIGPVTSRTARDAGLSVAIQSPGADMARLAGAIAAYFEKRT